MSILKRLFSKKNSMIRSSIYFIIFFSIVSCNTSNKQPVSSKVLSDSATSITKHYKDTTKFSDALKLLNQAISIDSSDFDLYNKKYCLEFSLGNFKEAEQTLTKLIVFRPDSAELYTHAGLLQEFRNDTTESKKSFATAMLLYKATMDTMDKKNPYWLYDWRMSAICMIMTGQEKMLKDFLKEHCTSAFDSSFYDIETLTKTRAEILQSIKAKYSR